MVSLNDVTKYIEKSHNEEEKQFLQNALRSNKCKFDYDMQLSPRQLAVIVNIPEFELINKKYYGLYFLFIDGNIGAWLAENNYGIEPTIPAGSYNYNESINTIIRKTIQNLNTCDKCGIDVGFKNLLVHNNIKYCKTCSKKV